MQPDSSETFVRKFNVRAPIWILRELRGLWVWNKFVLKAIAIAQRIVLQWQIWKLWATQCMRGDYVDKAFCGLLGAKQFTFIALTEVCYGSSWHLFKAGAFHSSMVTMGLGKASGAPLSHNWWMRQGGKPVSVYSVELALAAVINIRVINSNSKIWRLRKKENGSPNKRNSKQIYVTLTEETMAQTPRAAQTGVRCLINFWHLSHSLERGKRSWQSTELLLNRLLFFHFERKHERMSCQYFFRMLLVLFAAFIYYLIMFAF